MIVDCHMHMILDGVEWRAAIDRHREKPDEVFIRRVLETYRKKGFTYLRDGGDRWGAGKRARELAPEYGICYRTPLAPLCKAGHYGAFIGEKYENFREYRDLVRKARADGADFIKLMISGLIDFTEFGRLTEEGIDHDEIVQMIDMAHARGFAVMAHANGDKAVNAALDAGVESIEHGTKCSAHVFLVISGNGEFNGVCSGHVNDLLPIFILL